MKDFLAIVLAFVVGFLLLGVIFLYFVHTLTADDLLEPDATLTTQGDP